MEERWHEDLVIHQSPDFPDTEGTFTGYEGLSAMNRELQESWTDMVWEPTEVEPLGGDCYLVLVRASARGRGSGIEMDDVFAHIITLRDGRAAQLDTYLSADAARRAAGRA